MNQTYNGYIIRKRGFLWSMPKWHVYKFLPIVRRNWLASFDTEQEAKDYIDAL